MPVFVQLAVFVIDMVQTAICELTGMEIANASLLCESSAAAEAMLMLYRVTKPSSKNLHNDFIDE